MKIGKSIFLYASVNILITTSLSVVIFLSGYV